MKGYISIEFEHRNQQWIWTDIRTIFFEQKKSIWTKTWSIMLNRNVNLKTIMDKQFEEKYEHSICTNIWTINFKRSIDLNRFINNQFERNYQQLTKKSKQPTWTDISTINLNRNINNHFWTKKSTINLNKNINNHFEQKCQQILSTNVQKYKLKRKINK